MPRLRGAVDSGHLPVRYARQVETVCDRLPQLCERDVAPALLHGDAHKNNVLSTAKGPVFIDPSAYYGDPEIDLAFVDFFAPVPDALFEGYCDVGSIDRGLNQRRELWRLPARLAMVEVVGPECMRIWPLPCGPIFDRSTGDVLEQAQRHVRPGHVQGLEPGRRRAVDILTAVVEKHDVAWRKTHVVRHP